MAEDALAGQASAVVEWASATRGMHSSPVSGDRRVVAGRPGGTLLAVIDGLGHGIEAAAAARAAATVIERHASEPLEEILRRCHDASTDTRGSAITLAAIDLDAATLEWAGVGNVAGVVLRSEPPATTKRIRGRAGIIGSRLPTLHCETLALGDGDLILLASDGIRPDFTFQPNIARPLQRIVDAILAEHALPNDDALVLAARYRRAVT